eukprot:TRINITY_DN3344_c0_g1_i4.p1 TRINITY_DN3344_c0_g1~~TRINITY_DN3344_c0_g1_i4.p1  ORF type:complete len:326 (+),score=18.57 TRINITY_DN3344_c0_g1_i4:121-1098(+)
MTFAVDDLKPPLYRISGQDRHVRQPSGRKGVFVCAMPCATESVVGPLSRSIPRGRGGGTGTVNTPPTRQVWAAVLLYRLHPKLGLRRPHDGACACAALQLHVHATGTEANKKHGDFNKKNAGTATLEPPAPPHQRYRDAGGSCEHQSGQRAPLCTALPTITSQGRNLRRLQSHGAAARLRLCLRISAPHDGSDPWPRTPTAKACSTCCHYPSAHGASTHLPTVRGAPPPQQQQCSAASLGGSAQATCRHAQCARAPPAAASARHLDAERDKVPAAPAARAVGTVRLAGDDVRTGARARDGVGAVRLRRAALRGGGGHGSERLPSC